jgi:hypothetical protein
MEDVIDAFMVFCELHRTCILEHRPVDTREFVNRFFKLFNFVSILALSTPGLLASAFGSCKFDIPDRLL